MQMRHAPRTFRLILGAVGLSLLAGGIAYLFFR
jgi:hypothetical protein